MKETITKNDKKAIQDAYKKEAMKDIAITEKDEAIIEEALKEAKMPVSMTDDDFKLGEKELDIRNLNKKNKEQMTFRMLLLSNVYLRQITQSLTDQMTLIICILKKMGVDNVAKFIDDTLLSNSQELQNYKKIVEEELKETKNNDNKKEN